MARSSSVTFEAVEQICFQLLSQERTRRSTSSMPVRQQGLERDRPALH